MGSHEAKLKGGGDGRSRAGGRGGEVMKQKSKGGGGWRDRAGGWVRQGHL